MERLIRRRRECPELGWGAWSQLEQEDPAVFALRTDWGDSTIVTLHNLAGREAVATVPLEDGDATLVDLFGTGDLPAGATVALAPYGHRWFRVRRPGQRVAP